MKIRNVYKNVRKSKAHNLIRKFPVRRLRHVSDLNLICCEIPKQWLANFPVSILFKSLFLHRDDGTKDSVPHCSVTLSLGARTIRGRKNSQFQS